MLTHHDQVVSIALYLVDLDAPGISVGDALDWLTPAEQKRYENQIEGASRKRFAIGRASLRKLVDAPAGSSDFSIGPNGKPHLPGGPHFSFAASLNHALIGITVAGPIGLDIETVRDIRPGTDWPQLYPALGAMQRGAERPGDSQAVRFLRAWTRLEALIKRDGGRLGRALDQRSAVADLPPDSSEVLDLELGGNLVSALAYYGSAKTELKRVDARGLLAEA